MQHLRTIFACLVTGALSLAGCDNEPARQSHLMRTYRPDGSLESAGYTIRDVDGNARKHGLLYAWHESGRLRSTGNWRRGRKHGLFRFWHENGSDRRELSYRDGQADGRFREWDEQGTLIRDERWVAGHRVP